MSATPTTSFPSADDPGPRYVAPAGRPTVAGTDALSVLAAAGIEPRLDVRTAVGFLAWDRYSSTRTFFEGLEAIPPRIEIERAHDATLRLAVAVAPTPREVSVDAAARELARVLAAATRDAILDATIVGLPLSGGLDSSAVALHASEAWQDLDRDPERLRFYHLTPRSGPTEVDHARAIAVHLGHPLVEIPTQAGDPYLGDEAHCATMDMPSDSGGSAAFRSLFLAMSRDGVDVVLTGDGGDEAVGSVGGRMPTYRAGQTAMRLARRMAGILVDPVRRPWRRRAYLATLPEWLAERGSRVAHPETAPPAREGLRGERAVRDRALRCALQTVIVAWLRGCGRLYRFTVRFPFYDPRVGDLVVALHPRVLQPDAVEKGLLRLSLAGRLPEAQRARPKDQPIYEGMFVEDLRTYGSAWLDRFLRGSPLERSGLIPMPGAEEILRGARLGDDIAICRARALIGLAAWCRVRGVSPAADGWD